MNNHYQQQEQFDLPQNWHSTSIAVKITAVVVWGVMPIAFALTIPLLSSIENEIDKDNLWVFDKIQQFVIQQINEHPDLSTDSLRDQLVQQKKVYPFDYLQLKTRNHQIIIGERIPDHRSYQHIHKDDKVDVNILMHFPSIQRGIELERMKYGSLIVIFTIILGLYLVYVVRNVLHSPFQRIIDATQNVIENKMNTRLDIVSQDEFGHLSHFFNHMVEKMSDQQQCLTDSNKHLESVLQNKEMALKESRSKSLFLANMSHEIRTPITAILGYAENLYHNRIADDKEKHEALAIIYRNSKHLIDIINDILDLSKLDADKLQVETLPFSPVKVLKEVEQLMAIQAREKGLQLNIIFHYPMPEFIENDPTRFKQVLFNLIANAIRFTDEGKVTVDIQCQFQEQCLNVSVVDNGIGLSQEQINHLFQPYEQANNATARKYGGTGLGLMIAKQLVQLMGGNIRVNSTIGEGAEFAFAIKTGDLSNADRITAEQSEALYTLERENEIPQLNGRILLVEDIADNQKLISLYLKQTGVEFDIANHGKEAISLVENNEYNLILMDMQMPVMDGLTATRQMRARGLTLPIIALTANVLKNERDTYLEAGCNSILTKPIIIDEFYNTLKQWLRSQHYAVLEQDKSTVSQRDDPYKQLVNQFLQSLQAELKEIENAISENNWPDCRKVVHNIKGRGGSFGFPELTRDAAVLDQYLKDKQYQHFKIKFNEFRTYCESLVNG
jgi:signal transduction histidine kinase/DNA-binding NarL/FixJ family response regulator